MTDTYLDASEWDEFAPSEWEALAGHLDDVTRFLARYIAFPSLGALHAVALWAVHTHCLDAFESTPRLALLSVEKQSGKTRTLEALDLVAANAANTVNMSAPALFRIIEASRPTLLLDEADTYLGLRVAKEHEELRGLVNAGHRRGAVAYRCVGEGTRMTVKEFPAFAAVALAGIGDLPDTIVDRAIVIQMKRRTRDEHVEPFRLRTATPAGHSIRDRLAAWAKENTDRLGLLEVELPDGITDRPADCWEPLVMLGDAAGDVWSDRARVACVALNAARQEHDPSLGVRLLTDVRAVFGDGEHLTTETLLELLCALEESPWGDLRGRPLDARGLARRLKPFGVKPKDVRTPDGTKKGYERADLWDAWLRYLPSSSGQESATWATEATASLLSPMSPTDEGEKRA